MKNPKNFPNPTTTAIARGGQPPLSIDRERRRDTPQGDGGNARQPLASRAIQDLDKVAGPLAWPYQVLWVLVALGGLGTCTVQITL